MAQTITVAGATYSDVPAVDLPKASGGTARFRDTSDADASAADIVSGSAAYGPSGKLNGTLVIQKYYPGSSAPSASLGSNGDIYLQTG